MREWVPEDGYIYRYVAETVHYDADARPFILPPMHPTILALPCPYCGKSAPKDHSGHCPNCGA